MEHFLYGLIDGSYQYGINNENSDIDIIEIYSSFITMEQELKKIASFDLKQLSTIDSINFMKKYNLTTWNPSRRIYTSEHFIYNLFFNNTDSYYRWLFPYKYLSNNEFTIEIQKINEDIIKENLPLFYIRQINYSNKLFKNGLQENNNKSIYKSFIELILLIEYYKQKNYKQSLQLGNYKPFILNIKNNFKNIKINDLIIKRNNMLKKISEIKNFYLNSPSKTQYQNRLIEVMIHSDFSKFYI